MNVLHLHTLRVGNIVAYSRRLRLPNYACSFPIPAFQSFNQPFLSASRQLFSRLAVVILPLPDFPSNQDRRESRNALPPSL